MLWQLGKERKSWCLVWVSGRENLNKDRNRNTNEEKERREEKRKWKESSWVGLRGFLLLFLLTPIYRKPWYRLRRPSIKEERSRRERENTCLGIGVIIFLLAVNNVSTTNISSLLWTRLTCLTPSLSKESTWLLCLTTMAVCFYTPKVSLWWRGKRRHLMKGTVKSYLKR